MLNELTLDILNLLQKGSEIGEETEEERKASRRRSARARLNNKDDDGDDGGSQKWRVTFGAGALMNLNAPIQV